MQCSDNQPATVLLKLAGKVVERILIQPESQPFSISRNARGGSGYTLQVTYHISSGAVTDVDRDESVSYSVSNKNWRAYIQREPGSNPVCPSWQDFVTRATDGTTDIVLFRPNTCSSIAIVDQSISGGAASCTFRIRDKNNAILYEKEFEGECPDEQIACGDGCPEGQCKCLTTQYPGYCCLDCNDVANQLRAIRQGLQSG